MNDDKVCIKCQILKPLDCYYKHSVAKGGYNNVCIMCMRERAKKYYLENKNTIDEKTRLYNSKNKEQKLIMDREYYKSNSEKLLKNNKKYREDNKSKIHEQRKGYRRNNKEKIADYKKKYYQTPIGRANKIMASRRRKALKKHQLHPQNNYKIEIQLELIRQRVENCLGIKHNLDHVWPLAKGGLHHIANLRIIPASINFQKHDNMDFKHPLVTMWYELPAWLIDDTLNWNKDKSDTTYNTTKLFELNQEPEI